jgi:hypothetical protein
LEKQDKLVATKVAALSVTNLKNDIIFILGNTDVLKLHACWFAGAWLIVFSVKI